MEREKIEEKKLSGKAADEQIAMWKNLHRDVFEVVATDKVAYFKRPDRNVLNAINALPDSESDRANDIVFENCWLGGDPEIKTKDIYFIEVIPVLETLIDHGRAAIKKL